MLVYYRSKYRARRSHIQALQVGKAGTFNLSGGLLGLDFGQAWNWAGIMKRRKWMDEDGILEARAVRLMSCRRRQPHHFVPAPMRWR